MKTIIFLATLFAATIARGGLEQLFTENTPIPDGNPVGVSFTGDFNQDPNAGDTVDGMTITLNVSGGYNGDLYAYMVSPNGTKVTLLDQPGVSESNPLGYSGSGLNVTFSDSAARNIQTTPETSGAVLTAILEGGGGLAAFNGSSVDGTWTLFFGDLSSGGGTSQLNNWSLDFTPVPEPGTWGLISGVGLLGIYALRGFYRRK